jgi:branched-chain amino acid transport system permease protein
MKIKKPGVTLYGLFIVMAILGAAGLLLGVAVSSILVLLLVYAALAYSINFITGMMGYVDFGHVLFMAIGSYALTTLVSYYGAHPLLGVGFGAVLGTAFALGIGLVILRFRGVYFAIATVVLALAAYNIVLQFPQFGAGGEIILKLTFQPLVVYFTIWTIVMIEIALTYYINRSKIGFGIRAIKSEEDAASSVGVSPQMLKLTGYMMSGLFGGAAGAVYSWFISGVTAGPAFDFTLSLLMLAMIIIGGVGTSIGPLLGAVVVYIPSYFLLTTVAQAQPLMIGLLVIVMALFLPDGIVGLLRRSSQRLKLVLE